MTQPFERSVLKNGVRLLLIPMPGVNSIATSVMVGVGSRYESASINGVSHFLEHMVFKGTEKYPTTDDVNVIERIGGLQNAYTDIDITNYHNKVLSSDWELALDINKELALHPRLEQEYVDKERDVILEEMKRYEDEPAAKVGEVFHTMLYKGSSLGMRIIGEEKSLRSVASEQLKQYHAQWYQPGKMVVVVAGSIGNNQERIKAKVEEWFGGLPSAVSGSQGYEPVLDSQSSPALEMLTKRDANQAHINLGVRTFARGNENRFAWGVFNLLMGVGFTSRLFKEIREKKGLCYQIRSNSDNWSDVGYWSIYAGVATEKVQETVGGIIEELKKVVEKGVEEDEIAVSKKRLQTIIAFNSEDPEFQNEYYGRQELFNEKLIPLEEYHSLIQSVTKEQIEALVRKYITTQTLNLAVVWNKPRDEKLLEMLRI